MSEWYDEEPIYEPMPEFLEKINELVVEGVKAGREEMLKEIEGLKRKNNVLTQDNYGLRGQTGGMESEIKRRVEEARKEFERDMFGGFMKGDPFFRAAFEWQYTPCETCKGVGSLPATLADGTEVKVSCPANKCDKGKIRKGVFVPKQSKVDGFRVNIFSNSNQKEITIRYRNERRDDHEIDLKECFKSLEEVQPYCDKKTAEYQARHN